MRDDGVKSDSVVGGGVVNESVPVGDVSAGGGASDGDRVGFAVAAARRVFLRALLFGGVVTVAIAFVFAFVGYAVSGVPGAWGGVVGAGVGGAFLLVTLVALLFTSRFVGSASYLQLFFGIVVGAELVKFVVFLVLLVFLRDAVFLDGKVFFFALLASVVVSLVLDVVLVVRSRRVF